MDDDTETLALLRQLARRNPPPPAVPDRVAFIEARRALSCQQPLGASGRLTLRCTMCANPFDREARSEEELEMIRRALLICDGSRPAVCDNCIGLHEYWRHKAQGPRGETFHDTPNFLLRYAARFPNGEPR